MSDETTTTEAAGELPVVDEAAAVITDDSRGARKVRDGVVVSDKMDKTVVVLVERRVKHPKYHKTVTKSKKYKAHDETNDAAIGDRVRIVETRPLSKDKRFRVAAILERAK
jgi:small subunit ribosomal protein S17